MIAPSRTHRTRLKHSSASRPSPTLTDSKHSASHTKPTPLSSPQTNSIYSPQSPPSDAVGPTDSMPFGFETAVAVAEDQSLDNGPAEDDLDNMPNLDGSEHAIASSDDGSSSLSELGDRIPDNDESGEEDDEEEVAAEEEEEDEDEEDEEEPEVDNNKDISDEADSEAETERLHISPDKVRTASTGGRAAFRSQVDSSTNGQVGKPPTNMKLADGQLSETESLELSEDESRTKSAMGKKRKRSEIPGSKDHDLEGEPLRKRSSISRLNANPIASLRRSRSGDAAAAVEEAIEEDIEVTSNDDEENIKEEPKTEDIQDNDDLLNEKEEAAALDNGEDAEEGLDDLDNDTPTPADVPVDDGDELEGADEEIDADGDDAEQQSKNEDELARKKVAMDALKPIENFFAILKDQLFNERDAFYLAEIEALKDPTSTHQEYLAMRQCLDARREEKIQLEHVYLSYRTKDLESRTLADRAQIHSQFAQRVRALREEYLSKLNERFCQIKTEFRKFKAQEPQYIYKFNSNRSQQIQQQRAYNTEVSILSGIARHVGFPAAPEFPAIKQADIEDDLRKMKIRNRPTSYAAQIANFARADEAAAEEQFLEKTPWANPNHPAHQNAVIVEQGAAPQPYRASSITTPSNPRWIADLHHKPNGSSMALSVGPDPPSSALGFSIGLKRTTSRENEATNGSPYHRAQSKYNTDEGRIRQVSVNSPTPYAAIPSSTPQPNHNSSENIYIGNHNSRIGAFGTPRQEPALSKEALDHDGDQSERYPIYNKASVTSPMANGTAPRAVGGVS